MAFQSPAGTILLKPSKNAEFDDEYDTVIPTEGEIRLLGNKNRQCQYYYLGIEQCRKKMLFLAGQSDNQPNHELGFLPCKRLVDAHYRCMTDEKYGYSIEDAPEYTSTSRDDFFQCAFKQLNHMSYCRRYLDEMTRLIYREPGTKLSEE